MKGEKFMAISYTYPRVDVNTTALTRKILTENVEDTLVMLSIFSASIGPVDTINRIHTLSQFESIYGTITEKEFGNNGLNIKNWLNNGGTVYAMRHEPSYNDARQYYDDGGTNIEYNAAQMAENETLISHKLGVNIFRKNFTSSNKNGGNSYKSHALRLFGEIDTTGTPLANQTIQHHCIIGVLELKIDDKTYLFPEYIETNIETGEIYWNRTIPFQLFDGGTGTNYEYVSGFLNRQDYDNRIIIDESKFTLSRDDIDEFLNMSDLHIQEHYRSYIKTSLESDSNYFEGENSYLELPDVSITLNGTELYFKDLTFTSDKGAKRLNFKLKEILYTLDNDHCTPAWAIDTIDTTKQSLLYDTALQNKDHFIEIFQAGIQSCSAESTRIILNEENIEEKKVSLKQYALIGKSASKENIKKCSQNISIGTSLITGRGYRPDTPDEEKSDDTIHEEYLEYPLLDRRPQAATRPYIEAYPEGSTIIPIYNDFVQGTLDVENLDWSDDGDANLYAFANTIDLSCSIKVLTKQVGAGSNNIQIQPVALSEDFKKISANIYLGNTLVERLVNVSLYDLINPNNLASDYIYISAVDGNFVHTYEFCKNLRHDILERMKSTPIYRGFMRGYSVWKDEPNTSVSISDRPNASYIRFIDTTDGLNNLLKTIDNIVFNSSIIGTKQTFHEGSNTKIQLQEGSLITLDNSIQSLAVYSALTSDTSRKILKNTLEFPIDIFFDAGYSFKTKQAIYNAFCKPITSTEFIRNDINVILDSFFIDNIYSTTPTRVVHSIGDDNVAGSTQVDDAFPKTVNTRNMSIYEQYYTMLSNNRNISVSPTYFLSKNIPYYSITLNYGTHSPIAGMKRGLIEGYKTINKQYLPDASQELFENDVNYATVYKNGTAFMSQRTREDDSQNTALQFFNNSFTTNRIAKELERLARAYLFEYNDAVSITNLRKTLNQYIGRYITDRVLTYAMLDVQYDEYNPEQLNIALNIKFNNSIEVIEVNLVIE